MKARMNSQTARTVTTALIVVGAALTGWLACGKDAASPTGGGPIVGPNGEAVLPAAGGLGAVPAGQAGAVAVPNLGDESCGGVPDFYACMMRRAQVTADLLDSLDELEGSTNPKAKEAGLTALKLPMPLVQEAALRVLAPFGKDETVAQQALSKLLGEVPSVQRASADLLKNNERYAELASSYRSGHADQPDFGARPTNVARWGFTAPASAQGFPPGDSARTVAIRTRQPLNEVAAFYSRQGAQTLTAAEFQSYWQGKTNEASTPQTSTVNHMKQVQAIMAEYQKTHDPKALERMQKLNADMEKEQAALPKFDQEFYVGSTSRSGMAPDATKIVVLERKGKVDTRLAVIYTDPTLHETVVQLSWAASVALPGRFANY